MNIYVRLNIISPALPVGAQAKLCIGAWVPTVSIHRPLSFRVFINRDTKKLTRIFISYIKELFGRNSPHLASVNSAYKI